MEEQVVLRVALVHDVLHDALDVALGRRGQQRRLLGLGGALVLLLVVLAVVLVDAVVVVVVRVVVLRRRHGNGARRTIATWAQPMVTGPCPRAALLGEAVLKRC